MPTYFTLKELLRSGAAESLNIDNTPTWKVVENLRDLTENILDPLRAAWGAPIRVTSGYRCPVLNEAVGGSNTSVHQIGSAADIKNTGSGATFTEFKNFVVRWLQRTGTKFDQVLIEKNKASGDMWLHIGQYNNAGQQRGIIKNMEI